MKIMAIIDPRFDIDSFNEQKFLDGLERDPVGVGDVQESAPLANPYEHVSREHLKYFHPEEILNTKPQQETVQTAEPTTEQEQATPQQEKDDPLARQRLVLGDLYAITHGEDGLKKLDAQTEEEIANLEKAYPTLWTEEQSKLYRHNRLKSEVDDARIAFGGSPIPVTNQNLLTLILNKNTTLGDIYATGYATDIKQANPYGSFSRGNTFSEISTDIQHNFFGEKSKDTLDDINNQLEKASYFYTNKDDGLMYDLGTLWDGVAGTPMRAIKNSSATEIVTATAGAIALTAITGGADLLPAIGSLGGYLFSTFGALDTYQTTKATQAYNAMNLDPSLTKDDAYNSTLNTYSSLGQAGVQSATDLLTFKIGGRLLKNAKKIDDAVLKSGSAKAIAQAKAKIVKDAIIESGADLGMSLGINTGIASASSAVQQYVTNLMGHSKDEYANVWDASVEGGKMGMMFGALPSALVPFKLGMAYRNVSKAQRSAINHANQKIIEKTLQNTDMYKADPNNAMDTAEKMSAFNETRFNINTLELNDYLKEQGVKLEDTPFAEKVNQADADGDTEISFTLKEREQLGKDWDNLFNSIGKSEIDDLPPNKVAVTLSEENQQKYNELLAEYGAQQLAREKEYTIASDRIGEDLYEGLRDTKLPVDKRDAFINMSIDLFKNLSEITGKPILELWEKYKPTITALENKVILGGDTEVRPNADKNGRYIPEERKLEFLDQADMVTGLHEYSHFVLDTLMSISKESKTQEKTGLGATTPRLDKLLNDALGADWDKLTGADLEKAHEKFVYQLLDEIASGESKYAGSQLMKDMRNMIVAGERRRFKELAKQTDQPLPQDVSGQISAEYQGRYKETLPQRSEGFNALAQALYRGEELNRVLDENYSPDSVAKYFELNEEGKQRLLAEHPELEKTFETMQKRAEDARDERIQAIQAKELQQTGRMFSFNDDFFSRMQMHTEDHGALDRWIARSKVAKKVFEKAKEQADDIFKTSVEGALYRHIKNNGILKDSEITGMIKLGMISRSTIKKLEDKGIIRDHTDTGVQPRSAYDYLGKVDPVLTGGVAKGKDIKYEDIARVLNMIANLPEDADVITQIARDITVKNLQMREMLSVNDPALRKVNLTTRERVAKDNEQLLKSIVKGTVSGRHKEHQSPVAMERVNDDQIIDFASERIVNETKLKDLNESNSTRKASSNNRLSKDYVLKGDYENALKASRAERMALAVTKKIIDARERIKKRVRKHADLLKSTAKHEKDIGKRYDNNCLDLARLIAERWGILKRTRRDLSLEDLQKIAEKDDDLKGLIEKAETSGMLNDDGYWRNKTVEQMNKLDELLTEIETVARNKKTIEINGQKYDADALAQKVISAFNFKHYFKDEKDANGKIIHLKGELMLDENNNPILRESAKRGTENKDGSSSVEVHALPRNKRQMRKGLGRVLNWCNAWDNGEGGVISTALYQVTHDISALGERATNKAVKEINGLMKGMHWREGRIVAHELLDPKTGTPLRLGDGRGLDGCGQEHLAGMLLHFGNEQNFKKLIEGMEWEEDNVNAFVRRMIKEGYITDELLDFVQNLWDKYDASFDRANQAYYEMHGTYMQKVTPREISFVMADGHVRKLKGGYAPLIADAERAPERTMNINWDAATPNSVEGALGITPNGIVDPNWSKERTNAVYPVDMNLIRLVNMIPKVESFAVTMPQIKKAYSFWGRDDIKNALNRVDPHAYDDVVQYTFKRLFKRNAEKNGDEFGAHWMKKTLGNVGMAIMTLNFPNMVTQLSGVVGAMAVVKPAYIIKALKTSVVDFTAEKERICGESLLMSSRIKEADSNLVDNVNRIVGGAKGDTVKDRLININRRMTDFQSRWAYIGQKVLQDRLDVAVYNGAFEQAKERIFLEKQTKFERGELPKDTNLNALTDEEYKRCVNSAEQAVIKTQSSSNTLDKSAAEDVIWLKPFAQFYNYFITQGNLLAEFYKRVTINDTTTATKVAVMSYVYLMSAALPSMVAEGIMKTARGDWWNDDLDGDDLMLDLVIQPIKQNAMSIPILGSMVNTAIDAMIKGVNTTQQFINTPLFSSLNSDWIGIQRMFQGNFDGRSIKIIGHMISLGGNPFAYYLSKQLGNAYDYATNKIKPDGTLDAVRIGLTTSVRSDTRKR